jgi:hypothetical protein
VNDPSILRVRDAAILKIGWEDAGVFQLQMRFN